MDILCCICVRAGSKRIPDKWKQKVGGMTLFDRTLYQAINTGYKVLVCTDHIAIRHLARETPGVIVMDQPPEFAERGQNKWALFQHIVKQHPCDILVDLDISCPFRTNDIIPMVVEMLADYEVAQTMYKSDRNPYFNMVDDRGHVIIPSGIANSQDTPIVYSLSPSVFAVRAEALKKYNHWSNATIGRVIIPREWAWDIDTPFDLKVARLLAERKE